VMFTRDDHTKDPIRFPICPKGHVWKQRGNRTGHCSKCHRTFEGIKLFDAHQRTINGVTHCLNPNDMTVAGEAIFLVEGSWRGPRMAEGVFAGSSDD
jgi:hypothetical protein